jgi:hypothetical protein
MLWNLFKKYRPKDTIAGVEYEKDLKQFNLKKGQDPAELFDHFVEINTQYGIDAPDEQKLIAIELEKLPERYVMAFSTLSVALDNQVDLDTFEETCEKMYCSTKKVNKSDEDNNTELNLSGFEKKKKKGKKWLKTGEYKGKACKHCRRNHHYENCWMLEKNKDKCPKWFDPAKVKEG